MTFDELEDARRIFNLPERASLAEIKARHRSLVKRHHPDGSGAGDSDAMRRINAAYRLLSEYCAGYRFGFSLAEFLEQNPEERLRRQFAQDPLWGGNS